MVKAIPRHDCSPVLNETVNRLSPSPQHLATDPWHTERSIDDVKTPDRVQVLHQLLELAVTTPASSYALLYSPQARQLL